MGTRDRVVGDVNLVKPTENLYKKKNYEVSKANSSIQFDDCSITIEDVTPIGVRMEDLGDHGGKESLDIINDSLIDINHYRFNNKIEQKLQSTCPIVPKYHATFG